MSISKTVVYFTVNGVAFDSSCKDISKALKNVTFSALENENFADCLKYQAKNDNLTLVQVISTSQHEKVVAEISEEIARSAKIPAEGIYRGGKTARTLEKPLTAYVWDADTGAERRFSSYEEFETAYNTADEKPITIKREIISSGTLIFKDLAFLDSDNIPAFSVKVDENEKKADKK